MRRSRRWSRRARGRPFGRVHRADARGVSRGCRWTDAVDMAALRVTPDYARAMRRLFPGLTAEQAVELKAVEVTPRVRRADAPRGPVGADAGRGGRGPIVLPVRCRRRARPALSVVGPGRLDMRGPDGSMSLGPPRRASRAADRVPHSSLRTMLDRTLAREPRPDLACEHLEKRHASLVSDRRSRPRRRRSRNAGLCARQAPPSAPAEPLDDIAWSYTATAPGDAAAVAAEARRDELDVRSGRRARDHGHTRRGSRRPRRAGGIQARARGRGARLLRPRHRPRARRRALAASRPMRGSSRRSARAGCGPRTMRRSSRWRSSMPGWPRSMACRVRASRWRMSTSSWLCRRSRCTPGVRRRAARRGAGRGGHRGTGHCAGARDRRHVGAGDGRGRLPRTSGWRRRSSSARSM